MLLQAKKVIGAKNETKLAIEELNEKIETSRAKGKFKNKSKINTDILLSPSRNGNSAFDKIFSTNTYHHRDALLRGLITFLQFIHSQTGRNLVTALAIAPPAHWFMWSHHVVA